MLLQSAHADYDKKRIIYREEIEIKTRSEKKISPLKGRIGHHKKRPKAKKEICVTRRRKCPKHKGKILKVSNKTAEIDPTFAILFDSTSEVSRDEKLLFKM